MRILLTPEATEGATVVSAAPPQEGAMPDSMKGKVISFDGSDPDVGNIREIIEQKEDGTEITKPIAQPPTTKEAPVTEKAAAVAESKKEDKLPLLPEVKPLEPAKVETTQTKKEIPKGERDYSIFSKEELPLVKATNNQQFALFESLKKDNAAKAVLVAEKEAKLKEIAANPNAIPTEWYNHPEAYALHPQFREAYDTFNKAQFEANHYKEQLVAIEAGEDWRTIVGWNNKTGEPVFGEEQKADARAKINCQQYMTSAANIAQQYNAGLQNFQQNFRGHYEATNAKVQEIIKERWPWASDEKDPRQAQVREFIKHVPVEYASHPSTRVASLLWATVFDFAKVIDDLRAQLATGKTVKEIQSQVEPKLENATVPDEGVKKSQKFKGVPATFDLAGMTD